jgi:KDO2-lipid IV(A) lauroyltransferase
MQRTIIESLGFLFSLCSPGILTRSGKLLGRLMWLFLPGRRRVARSALEHHLGYSPAESSGLIRRNFEHTGRSFLEILHSRKVDHRFMQNRVRVEEPEGLESVISAQRPIVAITGHFGAWELLSGFVALYFPQRPCQIVVRHPKNEALKEMMLHFRAKNNVEIVSSKQAAPRVRSCLSRNGLSGFLVDHNTRRSQSVFLPFLRDYAAVNMGPALLALRSRAIVWPVFMARDGDGYVIHNHRPLDTQSLEGTLRERMLQVAEFYTREVEAMVRRFPEQWFWMHRRWKTRPDWERRP